MVEVFKTNVQDEEHARMLVHHIHESCGHYKVNFDLEDCDRILRIEANEIELQPIQNLLLNSGFTCIPLE